MRVYLYQNLQIFSLFFLNSIKVGSVEKINEIQGGKSCLKKAQGVLHLHFVKALGLKL